MAGLWKLKIEAMDAASFRGHAVILWQAPHHGEHRSYQLGTCTDCGMQVCINTRPMPNEIDIGGELVALNCPQCRERLSDQAHSLHNSTCPSRA